MRLEAGQVAEREFTLRTRESIVAVALAVDLQVVNPCKGLVAFRAREVFVNRQMNCTVALKTVFPLKSFSTSTREGLDTQVDVFVALQRCRVVENQATRSTKVVQCSMIASHVHFQIGRPGKLPFTDITRKSIAVCVDFQVPLQLDVGPKSLSTYRTFVSDVMTLSHVAVHDCFRLKILCAALALERELTIFPVLVPFQDSLGLESSSTDVTLVAVYFGLLKLLVQVKIDISFL